MNATPLKSVAASILQAIALLGASMGGQAVSADESVVRFSRSERRLGTLVTIVVDVRGEDEAAGVLSAGFRRIDELDAILSDYRADSEVNRLCQSAPHKEFVSVSHELFEVLRAARGVSVQSGGAFDVTIGPVTRLWRRARRRKELPPSELLSAARQAVGYEKIELRDRPPGVRLKSAKMRIDLGGIAKGYIVDEVLRELMKKGALAGLVNAGGDIGVSAPHDARKPWRVGVASLDPKKKVDQLIVLSEQAIATSGDAYQSVEIDSKRYSHIVDPRTGVGVTRQSSVTVIAPRADLADAWASALSVLGPEKGLKAFPAKGNYHAKIFVGEPNEMIKVFLSDNFPAGRPINPSPPNRSSNKSSN